MKQTEAVLAILPLLYKHQPDVCCGCSTTQTSEALLAAINLLGWEKTNKHVVATVTATPSRVHQHAAMLALRLGRMGGRLKEAAATVACEVGNKFIGAQTLSSMGAAEVAQMLFYFPNCIELCAAITSRASELSTASLAAVLGAILPIAVRQCLKVFRGWLRSTVRACFWTITELSNSKDHVIRVFSILLKGGTARRLRACGNCNK